MPLHVWGTGDCKVVETQYLLDLIYPTFAITH